MSNYQALVDRFRRARRDPSLAVLEGFHSLKHAHRFGAALLETVTSDTEQLSRLTESLAPDLIGVLGRGAVLTPQRVFQQLSPVPPATGVIAIAQRPQGFLSAILSDPNPAPAVLLENSRSHGNIGAAVRVAAAAGATGLVSVGQHDPWHSSAVVGAAGLHFALPVAWVKEAPFGNVAENLVLQGESGEFPPAMERRPLVAVDPDGETLRPGAIPERALLAFGSERDGLSPGLLVAADRCIAIPMESGVASLNLATAVAVVLYAWRLAREGG